MEKSKQQEWKAVELPGDIISKGIEGLIGIEELTDYKIINNANSRQSSKKGKFKKKLQENKSTNKDNAFKEYRPIVKKKRKHVRGNAPNNQSNYEESDEPQQKRMCIDQRKKKSKHLRNCGEGGQSQSEKLDEPVSKGMKVKKRKKRKKKIILVHNIKTINENEGNEEPTETRENDFLDNMSAWYGLGVPRQILKALDELGFRYPTEIQARTLPAALMGRRDILGAAETGSGKTLAFGIPILHHIMKDKIRLAEKNSEGVDKTKNDSEDEGKGTDHGSKQEFIEENDDSDDEIKKKRNELNKSEETSEHEFTEENGSDSDEVEDNKADIELDDCEQDKEEDSGLEDEEYTTDGIGCVRVINNIDFPSHLTPKKPNSQLYALILTPTRELAIQINNHLKAAAKYTGIKTAVVIGGMSVQKQERLLMYGPEIVVATPGRLWEMIEMGNSHLSQVQNIKYLAVDETDRMLEKGHFQELQKLLEILNVNTEMKKQRQNFVFSATLTLVHDPPLHAKAARKSLKITPGQKLQSIMDMLGITNPKVVDVTTDSGTAGTLKEARILCTLEEKDLYLYYFLQRYRGRTLVFCNSINSVRRLTNLLGLLKCQPLSLHANMIQRQRLKNLDRFRDNPYAVLLATDVAARGLDIPDVQHVVHYQVPRTSESYVHRSGRTARAKKEGLTLLLIDPSEVKLYVQLCNTLGRSKDIPLFPVMMSALDRVKKRVSLARELDRIELTSRRSTSESGWYRKALKSIDMFIDEDEVPKQMDDEDTRKVKRLAAIKRKELDALLSRSLFPSSLQDDPLTVLQTENSVNKLMGQKKKGKNKFMRRKERRKKKNKN